MNAKVIDYDLWVHYMDDEIREEVHMDLAPCTEVEFLNEYKKRHPERFGEEFNPFM